MQGNNTEQTVRYRTKWLWQTTAETAGGESKLLGHNGEHVMRVCEVDGNAAEQKIAFEPVGGGALSRGAPFVSGR